MNAPAPPAAFLSTRELQVINRFRHQRMDTWKIAKSLHLPGGEPEAVRLLASAREKERGRI